GPSRLLYLVHILSPVTQFGKSDNYGSWRRWELAEIEAGCWLSGVRQAATRGFRLLQQGKSSIKAVDAAVVEMEDNPVFNAGSGSDRKSTRLSSSHQIISYAVFCLKKK